ncbi:MAG: hypothetical protein KKC03_13855 [Bacteroidetes bacterium]|nr:hypothetical protein [Bacteroidota bacterium]
MEKSIGIFQGEGIAPKSWKVKRVPFNNCIIESHNGQLNVIVSTVEKGPALLGNFQEFIILAKNESGKRVVLINATVPKKGIMVEIKP